MNDETASYGVAHLAGEFPAIKAFAREVVEGLPARDIPVIHTEYCFFTPEPQPDGTVRLTLSPPSVRVIYEAIRRLQRELQNLFPKTREGRSARQAILRDAGAVIRMLPLMPLANGEEAAP